LARFHPRVSPGAIHIEALRATIPVVVFINCVHIWLHIESIKSFGDFSFRRNALEGKDPKPPFQITKKTSIHDFERQFLYPVLPDVVTQFF
jgi:hypothetical protein